MLIYWFIIIWIFKEYKRSVQKLFRERERVRERERERERESKSQRDRVREKQREILSDNVYGESCLLLERGRGESKSHRDRVREGERNRERG